MEAFFYTFIKKYPMAILKLSAFITQISGKIAGSQFANTPAGVVVKNIGTRSKKLFPKVATNLNVFANTSQSWRLLTDIQRANWNLAAADFPYINRIGESRIYSGYNLFVKFNGSLKTIDKPIINIAPTPHTFIALVVNSVTSTGGNLIFNIASTDPDCFYICRGFTVVNGGATSTALDTTIFFIVSGPGFVGVGSVALSTIPIFQNAVVGSQLLIRIDAVFKDSGQAQRQVYLELVPVQ